MRDYNTCPYDKPSWVTRGQEGAGFLGAVKKGFKNFRNNPIVKGVARNVVRPALQVAAAQYGIPPGVSDSAMKLAGDTVSGKNVVSSVARNSGEAAASAAMDYAGIDPQVQQSLQGYADDMKRYQADQRERIVQTHRQAQNSIRKKNKKAFPSGSWLNEQARTYQNLQSMSGNPLYAASHDNPARDSNASVFPSDTDMAGFGSGRRKRNKMSYMDAVGHYLGEEAQAEVYT
jgi:hypothetical protein